MTSKPRTQRRSTGPQTIESLYLDLLRSFYGDGDRKKARQIAARLSKALVASPEFNDSIRAEEVRSLIAELHGDLVAAIKSREAEIRKIFELHSLAINTPNWQHVFKLYDFSDISDRLDLLAILYDGAGDLDRAILTLRESKQFCEAHKVPFDGQEILEELEASRETSANGNGNGQKVALRSRSTAKRSSVQRRRAAGASRRYYRD